MASSIAKVCSVKSCMLYKDNSRVELLWKRRSVTSWMPTCNAAFFFAFRILCIFFIESHVDQTVDHLGTRVAFTENEDLSKKSAGPRQRNLVAVEVYKSVSTKLFACLPAWSSDNRWSEMIWAPGTSTKPRPTPWQRCKWRLVFDCVCTVTRVFIQKRAKSRKITNKKTD